MTEFESTNFEDANNESQHPKDSAPALTQEQIFEVLDTCYQKAIAGIDKVSPPIEKLANDYLEQNITPDEAAKAMIKNQIKKCTTSGFLTGLGGVITMPLTIPANLGSVLYVQMRMIACTAYIAGLDVESDQVQTLTYACLAGVSVNEVIKKAGVQFGQKLANSMIRKIPGEVLKNINQKIGFRLITKFGEKGILNLGKVVPVVGGVINGGLDWAETKAIGNRSYKLFFEGISEGDEEPSKDIDSDDNAESGDVIDVDFE